VKERSSHRSEGRCIPRFSSGTSALIIVADMAFGETRRPGGCRQVQRAGVERTFGLVPYQQGAAANMPFSVSPDRPSPDLAAEHL
jgi:hypothetical protein